jgi:type IV secretion system protein VirB9
MKILLFIVNCFFLTLIYGVIEAKDTPSGMYLGEGKNTNIFKNVAEPIQIGPDQRFKGLNYVVNTVYRIQALYDYPTYIEFEKDEVVTKMIKSKQRAWQLVPDENKLYIMPLVSDADMPLTVMTNKRTYFFELEAKEPSDSFDEVFAFFIKFQYPSEKEVKSIKTYTRSILPNLTKPELYNFNYTISGDPVIYPVKVFDDGLFTYFEFKQKGGILPAVFVVDSSDNEAFTNFKMIGDYLVVESTSPRYTLRYGNSIVCVFNENLWKELKKSR